MTTIIFDGKKVYADSQYSVTADDDTIERTFTGNKIWTIDGAVCAGAGTMVVSNLLRDRTHKWMVERLGWTFVYRFGQDNWEAAHGGTSRALVVKDKQPTVYRLFAKVRKLKFFRSSVTILTVKATVVDSTVSNVIVLGSGGDFAKEFLEKGYDPKTTIQEISKKDPYTNDIIYSVEV